MDLITMTNGEREQINAVQLGQEVIKVNVPECHLPKSGNILNTDGRTFKRLC